MRKKYPPGFLADVAAAHGAWFQAVALPAAWAHELSADHEDPAPKRRRS